MPHNYTVPRFCECCGRQFFTDRGALSLRPARFCSHACANASRVTTSRRERFWSHVNKDGDCWLWTGSLNNHGYGTFGSGELSHRISWVFAYGTIPVGLFVLHHCDNPLCIRPEHLFLGTQSDNVRDMLAKGRASWQRQPRR